MVNREEALEFLKLTKEPSTEQILNHFQQVKMHEPINIKLYEQAKDVLLIENLRQDCLQIGELLKEAGLELEITINPPYFQHKIEFEEHKRNIVTIGTAALKEETQKILEELRAWDDLRRHPKLGTALEYFHFDNQLPKLYNEIFSQSIDDHHLSIDKLTSIKISLLNYRNYIFENLKNYCMSIIEQFQQAKIYSQQIYLDMQNNINACQTLKQLSETLLHLIEEENNQLNLLKENCITLERMIKGIHSPKPSHVFSPILHWSYYQLLLLEELKNQSINQIFHLCKDFSKEEVSWNMFFNHISFEMHQAESHSNIMILLEYFKELTLQYYQIKDWLKIHGFKEEVKTSLKAAIGLIPPNLRPMLFQWLKTQKIEKNILVGTIIAKTLELAKNHLMSLSGIAPYSYQVRQTSDLRVLANIDIQMRL